MPNVLEGSKLIIFIGNREYYNGLRYERKNSSKETYYTFSVNEANTKGWLNNGKFYTNEKLISYWLKLYLDKAIGK